MLLGHHHWSLRRSHLSWRYSHMTSESPFHKEDFPHICLTLYLRMPWSADNHSDTLNFWMRKGNRLLTMHLNIHRPSQTTRSYTSSTSSPNKYTSPHMLGAFLSTLLCRGRTDSNPSSAVSRLLPKQVDDLGQDLQSSEMNRICMMMET
jgi:hypothetical protein